MSISWLSHDFSSRAWQYDLVKFDFVSLLWKHFSLTRQYCIVKLNCLPVLWQVRWINFMINAQIFQSRVTVPFLQKPFFGLCSFFKRLKDGVSRSETEKASESRCFWFFILNTTHFRSQTQSFCLKSTFHLLKTRDFHL